MLFGGVYAFVRRFIVRNAAPPASTKRAAQRAVWLWSPVLGCAALGGNKFCRHLHIAMIRHGKGIYAVFALEELPADKDLGYAVAFVGLGGDGDGFACFGGFPYPRLARRFHWAAHERCS